MQRNNVLKFCDELRTQPVPYHCPIAGCKKTYQSSIAIKVHLYTSSHDHTTESGIETKRDKTELDASDVSVSQQHVDVETDGVLHLLDTKERLQLLSELELTQTINGVHHGPVRKKGAVVSVTTNNAAEGTALREPMVRRLNEINTSHKKKVKPDGLAFQLSFRRQLEKSDFELENEVEYELDELVSVVKQTNSKQRFCLSEFFMQFLK